MEQAPWWLVKNFSKKPRKYWLRFDVKHNQHIFSFLTQLKISRPCCNVFLRIWYFLEQSNKWHLFFLFQINKLRNKRTAKKYIILVINSKIIITSMIIAGRVAFKATSSFPSLQLLVMCTRNQYYVSHHSTKMMTCFIKVVNK